MSGGGWILGDESGWFGLVGLVSLIAWRLGVAASSWRFLSHSESTVSSRNGKKNKESPTPMV